MPLGVDERLQELRRAVDIREQIAVMERLVSDLHNPERRHALSSQEVVDRCIGLIEAQNPRLQNLAVQALVYLINSTVVRDIIWRDYQDRVLILLHSEGIYEPLYLKFLAFLATDDAFQEHFIVQGLLNRARDAFYSNALDRQDSGLMLLVRLYQQTEFEPVRAFMREHEDIFIRVIHLLITREPEQLRNFLLALGFLNNHPDMDNNDIRVLLGNRVLAVIALLPYESLDGVYRQQIYWFL